MPFFAVPAIVATRNGEPAFAAAGSGGYAILAGVINTLVGVVDHRLGVQAAIDVPRVHSQGHQTFVDARVPSRCATAAGARPRARRAGRHAGRASVQPRQRGHGRRRAPTDPVR